MLAFIVGGVAFPFFCFLTKAIWILSRKLIGAHCWLWWEEGRRPSRASRCHLPHPEVASSFLCAIFCTHFLLHIFFIILANCCRKFFTIYHTQKWPAPYLPHDWLMFIIIATRRCGQLLHIFLSIVAINILTSSTPRKGNLLLGAPEEKQRLVSAFFPPAACSPHSSSSAGSVIRGLGWYTSSSRGAA